MIIPPLRMLVGPVVESSFFGSSRELNSGWFTALGPNAIHVAALNKTILTWFGVGVAGYKSAIVAAYDHATKTWSERVVAGNFLLADDDHGQNSIVQDASGYFYIFYGSHASPQQWSISTRPNDISAWTQQPSIANPQTYPSPVLVGSTIWLVSRDDQTVGRDKLAIRSAAPSGGLATFTTFQLLVDHGVSSRSYHGEVYSIGTDVHIAATRSDGPDTARKGIYYYVYKTATGALENHNASVSTASGSLPISDATANASYRIYDHGSGQGDIPSLCFDAAGDAHILFADDGGAGTYQLMHMKRSSGTWSTPAALASLTDIVPGSGTGQGFCTTYTAIPGAAGTIEAWYLNAAGSKVRRIRSASGVWSAEELIVTAGSYTLMGQTEVRSAAADFRLAFTEVAPQPASDAGSVLAKRYAYGDSGFITASIPTATIDASFANVVALLGFEQRDGSTVIVNEAVEAGFTLTANGNAQVDTAQAKFGSASLLLDGAGDYLQFPHHASMSVSNGDFTVECWVRRNTSKLQAICSKRPNSGTSEFAFYIDASNRLLMQAFDASVAVVSVTGTGTLSSTSTWYHCALSRSGTTWRMFLDGVLEGSATQSGAPTSNSIGLRIGRSENVNTARDFNGWIDEFRFTAGVARYTAAFTPPAAAFPRI